MKYAFVHHNFRKLSFEEQVVFLCHFLTLFFCFFPWFSANPVYDDSFFYTAFGGVWWLIGVFVFLVSFIIVLFFLNKLFEYKKFEFSFSESYLYTVGGIEQIIFLVFIGSILFDVSGGFDSSSVSFGFFGVVLAQIIGLTAAFLQFKNEERRVVEDFFNSN